MTRSKDLKQQNRAEPDELIESISSTNKNFRSVAEGIITVKRKYAQIVELSRGDRVLRELNLNFERLQLEEKLLAVRLLSILDIKKVKEMKGPASEVRKVEEILPQIPPRFYLHRHRG